MAPLYNAFRKTIVIPIWYKNPYISGYCSWYEAAIGSRSPKFGEVLNAVVVTKTRNFRLLVPLHNVVRSFGASQICRRRRDAVLLVLLSTTLGIYILGSISRTIECVGAKTFSFVVCLVVAYGKAKRMSEMRLKCTSKTKPSLIPDPHYTCPLYLGKSLPSSPKKTSRNWSFASRKRRQFLGLFVTLK